MMRLLIRCVIAIPVLLTLTPIATADMKLPQPQGLVNDFAKKLSPRTKQSLETTLSEFRESSGVEFTVVIISFAELQGYAIEDYSLQLGRRWGVGRGAEKLGLLLVVAIKPPDKKGVYQGQTRLEVSRRLERTISNNLAGELIRTMRDDLKAGRFDQAITSGTNSIMSAITSIRNSSHSTPPNNNPPASAQHLGNQSTSFNGRDIFILFFYGFMLVAVITTIVKVIRGTFRPGRNYSGYYNRGDYYGPLHMNHHHHGSHTSDTGNNSFNSPGFFGGSSGSDGGSNFGGGGDSGGGGDFGGGGSTDSW